MDIKIDFNGFIRRLNKSYSNHFSSELIVDVFENLNRWACECNILPKAIFEDTQIETYLQFVDTSRTIIGIASGIKNNGLAIRLCELYNKINCLIYDSYVIYTTNQIKDDIQQEEYRERSCKDFNEFKIISKIKEELEQDLISILIKRKRLNTIFDHFNNYRPLVKSLVKNKKSVINVISNSSKEIKTDTMFLMLNCIKQFETNEIIVNKNSLAFKRLIGTMNASKNKSVVLLTLAKDYNSLKRGMELLCKDDEDEEIFNLKELLNEIDSNNARLDDIKELTERIVACIEKREDDFAMSTILLAGNIGYEEKKELLRNFFCVGYDYGSRKAVDVFNNHFFSRGRDITIKDLIDRLMNTNKTLVNMVVAGEHLFEKIEHSFRELKGDYTFLVASQIKAVDRYLKETIIRRLQGETITLNNKQYTIRRPCLDSLSHKDRLHSASIGNIDCLMSEWLMESEEKASKLFTDFYVQYFDKSVFFKSGRKTIFYKEFCNKIRNNKFHSYNIESVSQAIEVRKSVAFWLACLLIELK